MAGKTGIVLGAQAKSDSNHPQEVYFGSDLYKSVNEMLAAQNVILYFEDKVTVFPDPALGMGSLITIQRAAPVKVIDGKNESLYRTWVGNVKELLAEKNIVLEENDVVTPGLESKISKDMSVKIVRVSEGEIKENVSVAFATISKDDKTIERGKTQVQTKGVTGKKEKTYHFRRENGVLISKVLVGEKVLIQKVDEVILKGTKPPLLSRGNYKDVINAAALKNDLSPGALYCLMMAESNGNYNSVNPRGPYIGLFQYHQGTWNKYSQKAGYSGANIYDPAAQINVTAWVLDNVGGGSWGPWGGCKNK